MYALNSAREELTERIEVLRRNAVEQRSLAATHRDNAEHADNEAKRHDILADEHQHILDTHG